MIDKTKNNTKIKLISLMSAIALWLYVMAVVDPEETKVLEDLPITINNMSEIKANDLMLYPETELTTDIYITGKLSYLQNIKPQDVHIYGDISNPIEGKNQLYLRANISERVTIEFKTKVIIVSLEKIVEEKRSVDINIEGISKDTIIDGKNLSFDNVKVSGPRSLVKEVQKVVGTIDIKDKNNDFTQDIDLVAVDIDGNEVLGVDLENEYVTVDLMIQKQKTVPIEIKIKEDTDLVDNIKDYNLSQKTIVIKGKNDVLNKIDKIYTKPIDIPKMIDNGSNKVELDIPKGVVVDNKTVSIVINTINVISEDLKYNRDEIEIRNNSNNIDTTILDIPESITVSIEYKSDIEDLDKSNILLYIDLETPNEDGKYEIKYQTTYQLDSVNIEPNTITITINE